jgi:hypothetical protein
MFNLHNLDDDETRVLKFAELQAMIETGREDLIPNSRVISEALNVNLPSLHLVQWLLTAFYYRMYLPPS